MIAIYLLHCLTNLNRFCLAFAIFLTLPVHGSSNYFVAPENDTVARKQIDLLVH